MTIYLPHNLPLKPISEIKPYDNNPRFNELAIDSVAKSIETFGFLVPVVIDSEGVLITGHTRLLGAEKLGMTEVPYVDGSHLSEEQVNAFRIADNRVAENSSWDEEALASEIQMLSDLGFDLESLGFTSDELDCLLEPVSGDCLDDLSHKSVCGDISTDEIKQSTHVSLSVGVYKIHIPVDMYAKWETSMVKKHETRKNIEAFIVSALGFDKFIEEAKSDD